MSENENDDVDVITTVARAHGTRLRSVALLVSVMSLFLPAVTGFEPGAPREVNIIELVSWSMVAPVAILAAIGMPVIGRSLAMFADILAAASALGVASGVALAWYFAISAKLWVGRDLGLGVLAMLLAAGLMLTQIVRSYRVRI